MMAESCEDRGQVHFGGGLAPVVTSPDHAVGDELDDLGVHRVDLDFEMPQRTFSLAPSGKIRTAKLKVAQDRPEEFKAEVRVSFLVGVGEAVFGRWSYTKPGQHD